MPQGREVAGAKGGGQLQPVLANTCFQRRQTSKKLVAQVVAMAQGGLMRNGGREFKAEAKIIVGLLIPAGDDFRLRQA